MIRWYSGTVAIELILEGIAGEKLTYKGRLK